jgi:riboflavin kinase/FMN adenylyltransferase
VKVLHEGEAWEGGATAVVAGAFDGVHLGHKAVLGLARRLGVERGVASVAALFPDDAPTPLLTTLEQRIDLLGALNLDYCYVGRSGDLEALRSLCVQVLVVGEHDQLHHVVGEELGGIEVVRCEAVSVAGWPGPVSSSAIREALAHRGIDVAASMLGRPYEVCGVVVHGDHRGRGLGFPTANLSVPGEIALPCDGIYAGWYLRPDNSVYPAAINFGRRPTFYGDEGARRLLEAHLLDFEGDLYGEAARVRFIRRLRGEVCFDSAQALVEQMRSDVEAVRELLCRC